MEWTGLATTKEMMVRHAPDQKEQKQGQEQYPKEGEEAGPYWGIRFFRDACFSVWLHVNRLSTARTAMRVSLP